MIAGPNGSGKSTIFNEINSKFDVGIYINPDEIQEDLNNTQTIDLNEFGISLPFQLPFQKFIDKSSLKKKSDDRGFIIDLVADGAIIRSLSEKHTYEASLLSDFIRENLIRQGKSLTFETVMSHESKLETLRFSLSKGYKNYLYFVGTESPEINIERVKLRVKMGGHPVDLKKIEDRYFRSMNLLSTAITHSYRSFIFDNSGKKAELILEVFDGKEITYHYNEVPKWIDKYIFNK